MLSGQPKRRIRLNWRAVGVFLALVVAAVPATLLVGRLQAGRLRSTALATVRDLEKAGRPEHAIQHLRAYLETDPDDMAALGDLARLLDRAVRTPGGGYGVVVEAAKVNDRLLRRLGPDGARSQDARRRLVGLYVLQGDMLLAEAKRRGRMEIVAHESRARTAVSLAEELIAKGADDPEAHRLLAMALQGLGMTGDPKALPAAVREFETALKGDPGDRIAAERLSRLLLDQKEVSDPARAEKVLDDLLAARPKDAAVRLMRHNFFEDRHELGRAAAELEKGAALDPENFTIHLTAANDALRRGDTAAARRHIAAMSAAQRDDIRVRLLRGMVDFGEQRPEDAIEGWRSGLMASDGSSLELTWWLAYALLQMGRVSEAQPLIEQFSRVSGGEWAPVVELLKAETNTRLGLPSRAAVALERVRNQVTGTWQQRLELALGRAYEAMWDESQALAAYRRAIVLDPDAPEPRLAAARILNRTRPAEALREVKQGLAVRPDDPRLYAALCGTVLRLQEERPKDRRNWSEFDDALKKVTELSPKSPMPAMIAAERLLAEGEPAAAAEALKPAVGLAPRNDAVALTYSTALARSGKLDEAIEVLRVASKSGAVGDRASMRFGLARLLLARGRGREAREVLSRDVDQLPATDRPLVWQFLGQFDASQGDLAGARAAYREFARLLPEDPRPKLALLDLAMSFGDEANVRETLASLKSLVGEKDLIWRLCQAQEILWEAKAAARKGGERHDPSVDTALKTARLLLEGILADAPQMPTAHLLHGDLLERLGLDEEAAAAYRRAWDRGAEAALPRLVETLTRLRRVDDLAELKQTAPADRMERLATLASLKTGDTDKAARLLTQSAAGDAGDPDTQLWRVGVLEQLGKLAEAEGVLNGLVKRRPGELLFWLRLIRVQAARHDTEAVAATRARMREAVTTLPTEVVDAQGLWLAGDQSAAAAAFNAAVALRPDDVETRRHAAAFYEATGRRDEALACLRHARDLKPGDRAVARDLASVLLAEAKTPEDWDRAMGALGPEGPAEPVEDRLARASVLARAKDAVHRRQAIERLEAVLADTPPESEPAGRARGLLTPLLILDNQPGRACEVAAVSARLGNDTASLVLYAETLCLTKNWDEAARQLERLQSVLPADDPRVVGLSARLVRERAEPGKAVKALEESVAARADGPGAEAYGRAVVTQIEALGPDNVAAAERVARRVADRHAGTSWMLAPFDLKRGKPAEALAHCRRSVEVGDTADRVQAARTAFAIAKTPKADPKLADDVAALLAEAMKRDPKVPVLALLAALLDHSRDHYNEAVTHYRRVLELQPGNATALNNLAWLVSEEQNEPSEALNYIEDLVHRVGREPHSLDTRGVILARLKRYKESINDLVEATRIVDSPSYRFHLAKAYRGAGREDDYRKNLDLALKAGLNPSQASSRAERSELESVVKP